MKEALLYQKLPHRSVRCGVCQRRCLIPEGQVGFCLSRLNKNGKFYSLLYGQITGIQVDPIEKKPFYHFKPGTQVATIGSWGCNFRCKQCLNSWCSWGEPATSNLRKLALNSSITPEEIVKKVINSGYSGIAFSYNEPVIWFEFALDIAKKFKAKSPKNFTVFVTNGSWTKETIDKLSGYIDAANIDFKGFSQETYQKQGAFFGQIPQMAVYAQKKGFFLETTTLLIPGINDNPEELKKMASWMVKKLGPDTSWHLSQYDPLATPDKEFQKIPFTPIEDLEKAAEIGKKEGLNHIYIWAPNSGYSKSDTFCPKCKKVVIKRSGWESQEINITKVGNCKFCGYKLNIIL